ncbi:hypothetical protein B0H65DRAFT_186572 [Neurospora tetraspora]|uniref:Uncharacterized protein n=1 Tax=Neurospora tetraspora TaxID=94610 RepID=A0AAE0JEY6_9PEZI|nr:hypothetical protein B0H65DRAFT_186572 [Neurospora tetraspora]
MTQPPSDNTTNTNDDEIFADVEAEAAAMAAAMGFSSFGQQAPLAGDSDADETSAADPNGRPSKKRRYNSRVDAYVGPTPQGTGANDVPVQRRVFASKSEKEDNVGDENEINLDIDDNDNDNDENPAAEASSTTTTITLPINPSLPPKPPQIQVSNHGFNNNNLHNQRGGHSGHGGRGGRGGVGVGVGGRGGHGGHGHGRGDPSKPWYTDYYDPSSNENPWERLEQQRGMEAVGSWLPSRSGGGGGGGRRGGLGSGSGSGASGSQQEGQPVV